MKKYIANVITGSRILCSVLLLFFPAFSVWFYVLYLICGFSDMVDGTIARRTNGASEFGAVFDAVSDFVFVAVASVKVLPALCIPVWLWIWIAAIAVLKIGNIVSGSVYRKEPVSLHTVSNKITGLLLFVWPLTIGFVEVKFSAVPVCAAATVSLVQDVYCVWKKKI